MGSAGKGNKRNDGALGGEERGRSPSGSEPNAGGLHEGPLPANGRWSTRRKAEVVMRMLAGEPIDALSRELGVEVYRLEAVSYTHLRAHETVLDLVCRL